MNYPHFTQQINLLKSALRNNDNPEKEVLLTKWIAELEVINEEIFKLEQIEGFASKLTEKGDKYYD